MGNVQEISPGAARAQNKPDVFVFRRLSKPTSYVVDRIRRRVSLMLSNDFEFCSLDDGLFPMKVDVYHSKGWKPCLWFYHALKLRNLKTQHICTFYGSSGEGRSRAV
jgi:hypothetical protein